jgi:hypothetical protein
MLIVIGFFIKVITFIYLTIYIDVEHNRPFPPSVEKIKKLEKLEKINTILHTIGLLLILIGIIISI